LAHAPSYQKMLLDEAINNMSSGLIMFDASERIVVCNRRYIEMYGLSPEIVKPGCTLHALMSHRKDSGSFSGDIDRYCRELRECLARTGLTRTPCSHQTDVFDQQPADGNGGKL
jgi:PAS domain-containing protein